MAQTTISPLTISLLLTGLINGCETAENRGENITIHRGSSFDSFSSLSPFSPCCGLFNAHRDLNTSCRCSQANSSFYEGNWFCANSEQLWNDEGCHYQLEREKDGKPVKLLSSTTGSLKLNKDPNVKCKFLRNGQSFNKYLSCEGEWRAIAADHLLSVFKLTTHYDTDVFLELTPQSTISSMHEYVFGKLVKLEVKCEGRIIHEKFSCVMVKIEGSTTCTLPFIKRTNSSRDCSFLTRTDKDFLELSSRFGNTDAIVATSGFFALLVEAIILLLAISAVIVICTFRTRNRSNKKIPGSPSYYRTESTKPLDSSCEAEADYAEPVDVLSRADSRDRNTANTSVQFDSISNPTYERGPDRLSIIESRGDLNDLLARTRSRPQKRRYTQPPILNITPRNASRKPFSMHATITEEDEGLQENLYAEVYDVRAHKSNARKTKLRYSDPFPAGPRGVFQGSRKAPLARNYHEETVIYEHPGNVIHSTPGHENQVRTMDDEILPNSRAPDLKLGSPEPTYVNTQMIHRDDQSLSPIYDDVSTPLDNTTGEHVYATLCCENPNECACDEGYGSPIRDNTAALNRIDSFEI